jgi:hypothetical protein
MASELRARISALPVGIACTYHVRPPNRAIKLFSGRLVLQERPQIAIEGVLQFNWFPYTETRFSGTTKAATIPGLGRVTILLPKAHAKGIARVSRVSLGAKARVEGGD